MKGARLVARPRHAAHEGKETIGTSALDAAPDMILEMPEDSYAPFWLAAGTTSIFVGLLSRHDRRHHRHRDCRASR